MTIRTEFQQRKDGYTGLVGTGLTVAFHQGSLGFRMANVCSVPHLGV